MGLSRASIAAVAVVAVAAMSSAAAHARGRKTFVHRVDLRSGKATLVYDVDVGRPTPGRERARAWWRPSAGGRQPVISVRALDNADSDKPGPRVHKLALVVLAGEQERLRVPAPDASGGVAWSALDGDMVVVGWASTTFIRIGIDLARGRIAWRKPAPDPDGMDARRWEHGRSAGNGRVFVYDHRAFESLEAASGTTTWRQARTPSDAADYVELCQASPARWIVASDQIHALDAGSGTPRWRASLGSGLPRWCLVQGDRVFTAWRTGIGSRDGERDILAGLASDDGRVVWRRGPGDMVAKGIAVAEDGLVLWSPDEGITRVDRRDGKALWRLPGVTWTSIDVLAGGDWFLSEGGCTRLDPGTGAVRWTLGESCRRLGETGLLVAVAKRQSHHEATVTLRQYSFAGPRLRREHVVHRYRGFCDVATSEVIDVVGDQAVVASAFTVLD